MKKYIIIFCIMVVTIVGFTTTSYSMSDIIEWSNEERTFMQEHPVIRVGVDPAFVPFEFFDKNGEHTGISSEYLKIMEEKTGMIFEVQKDLTWPQAYNKALENEIDLLSSVGKTKERQKYFLFSEPYLNFKRVIVTSDDNTTISNVDDLVGKSVSVQKNSSHHSYLLNYPGIHLSLYDSVETALTNVSNGTELVFLGNLATTDYMIHDLGLTNLRYIAFESEKQESLYFAVRKDWPQLQSIINKVIGSISDEKRIEISRKWINVDNEVDYTRFIRIIVSIVVISIAVLAVSAYWIVRLKNEISIRKAMEEDLISAKRIADEANEAKSKFLSHMSHEIRTPLNAILGMIQIATNEDSKEKIAENLSKMEINSKHLLGIVNDILDFSKMESENMVLEEKLFSLSKNMDFISSMFQAKAEEKGIDFKIILEDIRHDGVISDSLRLNQVLINFLSNAFKFTDRGGSVEVSVKELAFINEKSVFRFIIKDNGIGIDSQQAKKLFTPFSQANTGITRLYGGTGLGLAISKGIVTAMGGAIELETEPGVGSAFSFTIQVQAKEYQEEETNVSLIEQGTPDLTGKNIMVVDDIEINREIIIALLEETNALMHSAENGKEALRIFCESSEGYFDVILMDMQMPVMDGCAATKAIRDSGRNDAGLVKIIAMTANVMKEDIDRAYESGMDNFLSKPVETDVLFQCLGGCK